MAARSRKQKPETSGDAPPTPAPGEDVSTPALAPSGVKAQRTRRKPLVDVSGPKEEAVNAPSEAPKPDAATPSVAPESPPALWEMQIGEPVDAFLAFAAYRDAGLGRSLAKIGQKLGKSTTWMELLSRTWHWADRLRAWVQFQDEMVRLAKIEELIEMNRRHSTVAKQFVLNVVERLDSIDLGDVNAQALARWFEVAVKVERLTLGEETDIVRQKFTQMTDSDLIEYLRHNMPVGSLPPAPTEEESDGSQ